MNHQSLKVLVSRTEFNDGLFDCISSIENLEIVPMGSIALKLGKLSYFECDLVISFRPKSIWDIAAGLVLTSRNNGVFYCEGLENPITHFQGELTYKSPMLFGSRSCLNRVDNIIKLLKV